MWDYNFGENKTVGKELELRIDHLERLAEAKTDANKPSYFGPEPSEKQLAAYIEGLVGLSYMYMARAVLRFRRQSMVKGGYYTRKSWVTLKEGYDAMLLQEKLKYEKDDQVEACLMFGLGFFNFLVSLIPPAYQFLVKMLGFEGDRQAAIVQLTKAKESRCVKRIEATLFLFALLRYFTDEQDAADALLEEMIQDYPDSPMVLYLAALMHRFKAQTERSITLLTHAVEKASHEQMCTTLHYHLGTTYIMIADYEKAIHHHQHFLQNTTGEQFQVWATYQVGLAKWMLTKDAAQVVPHFRFVADKAKDDIPLEKIAARKAREFLKSGTAFSEYQTKLLLVQHIHEGQLWSRVLQEVKVLKKLAQTDEERATVNYYRASALNGLKEHTKAHKHYSRVLTAESHIKSQNFTYIVPYTWAELGETELELGNIPRAKELLKKAKKYEDYDWANLLSVRISATMDKVTRREHAARPEAAHPS